MTTNAVNERAIALDILLEMRKEGAMSHLVLQQALTQYQYLDKNQRSFITRLVRGTVERRLELEALINRFSKLPVSRMKPVIANLLLLSVYQLRYMPGVPASAVCNEAVKLAGKRHFNNLKGFVNGVLRNIARNPDTCAYPPREKGFRAYASVRYSTPLWLVDQWEKEYGQDQTEAILAQFEETSRTFIRCNTAKIEPQKLKEELESSGIQTDPVPGLPEYAMEISGYDYLQGIPDFEKGFFQIQDRSSMLAGELAGFRPGEQVLDVCAAPGGKSINAALLLRQAGGGSVEARDLTERKTDLIRDNLQRLSLTEVTVREQDAREFSRQDCKKWDVVLADLPCSGLGIIGRKPDIKYHMTPEKLHELAGLQREILSTVWQYVKPGGRLVYSTCTINREENEENTAFCIQNFPLREISRQQILPDKERGGDGFYVAVLQRKEEE